jgi:hypothetical protein
VISWREFGGLFEASGMIDATRIYFIICVGGFGVHVVRRLVNVMSTSMTLERDRRCLFQSPLRQRPIEVLHQAQSVFLIDFLEYQG